jgi:hypothetical protein
MMNVINTHDLNVGLVDIEDIEDPLESQAQQEVLDTLDLRVVALQVPEV